MASMKITDLKPGPYRDVLLEAEKRCFEETGLTSLHSTAILLIGLSAMIADLRNEIKELKESKTHG